jgi:hypothetical protein
MNITYSWNNKTVDVYPELDGYENVIFKIEYILTGVYELENKSSIQGIIYLNVSEISDFIDFNSITEDLINNWVEQSMGNKELETKKEIIYNKIYEILNPKTLTKTINK